MSVRVLILVLLLAIAGSVRGRGATARPESGFAAPIGIQLWQDHQALVVLTSGRDQLLVVDPRRRSEQRSIALPGPGGGLLVRHDTAYVSLCEPAGQVLLVDLPSGNIERRIPVGHSPTALALSADERLLCVANRFDNSVDLIDLRTGHRRSITVVREPIALALVNDEKHLYVANHLPCVRPFLDDENPVIAAEVSVIDVEQACLVRNIELPNGSQGLRNLTLSPSGRYVVVTHILSNFTTPTMRIERGAMNRNAMSLISVPQREWWATCVLDDPQRGAANPWSACFTEDGSCLLVTHAGTHELSVIDFAALERRVASGRPNPDLFDERNLHLMEGIRRRVPLTVAGPRDLLVMNGSAYVAGYFSGDLASVSWDDAHQEAVRVAIQDAVTPSSAWLGERYVHDAELCYEHWQSCATCHPDGRSDALYWDLLNDGVGNTKNTKSLLMSALTPPSMWRGVRANAGAAIRGGIHHIQFATPDPEQAEAIEQYLRQMPAVPSPYLNAAVLESPKTEDASCAKCHYPGVPRGSLTAAATRGKTLFEGKAGCVTCHPHPKFTSQQQVDPGLGAGVAYDVPSLIEVWRTAPYLHAGDALDLRETITDWNFQHRRGDTHSLNEHELDDLLEYLRSL